VPPRSVNPGYEPRALYSRLFQGGPRNCHWLCMGTADPARAGAQIIFPISGRGLGRVIPAIFGIRSNIIFKTT